MVATRNSKRNEDSSPNKPQKRSVQLTPDCTKNKEEIENSPYSGRKLKLHKELKDSDKSKKSQKGNEIIEPPKLKKVETSINIISPCKNFTREINVQSQKYTPESMSPFDKNGTKRSFQHKNSTSGQVQILAMEKRKKFFHHRTRFTKHWKILSRKTRQKEMKLKFSK